MQLAQLVQLYYNFSYQIRGCDSEPVTIFLGLYAMIGFCNYGIILI